jgi:hypothetical protein
MRSLTLRVVTLLLVGLLTGAVCIDWLLNVVIADSALYTGFKQREIPVLTATLVPLGVLTTGLGLLQAYLDRRRRPGLWLTLAGVAGLLSMGLVTRLMLFPLNDQILSWSAQAPPADWSNVREQWNRAHGLRTVVGVASFALLLLGALVPEQRRAEVARDAKLQHRGTSMQG